MSRIRALLLFAWQSFTASSSYSCSQPQLGPSPRRDTWRVRTVYIGARAARFMLAATREAILIR
eukprot:748936-Hanusia_phi.AAC.1